VTEKYLRRLRGQAGMALPIVIGMMLIFTISLGAVIVYSSGSQHDADAQKKGQAAHHAAEAALATAISTLASAPDPRVATALPPCNAPVEVDPDPTQSNARGDYCGVLSGMDWAITARGFAKGTDESVGQLRPRVLTQVASIVPFYSGGLGELWNRLYQYDTSRCAEFKKIIIPVPVVTRGCVKLAGDDQHPSRLVGAYVSVGGTVELKHSASASSIGTAAEPVPKADIAGTCDLEHGSGAHSPCSAIDAVYANAITATPVDLARPTVDFPYWYANAKPGPAFPCNAGTGLPSGSEFDQDTSYDGGAHTMDLTPKDESYSCQYWSGTTLVGELSWNHLTHVLKVTGTIFFDGDVEAKDKDAIVNYQGRGAIYTSGKLEIEQPFCAGGDGTHDCQGDITDWDPTQNILIFVTGGLRTVSEETFRMNKDEAVFQGAVWSQGKCRVGKKASVSAPLLCGQLGIKEDDAVDDPTINPWPATLISSGSGQVYGDPAGDFQILLRDQLG
jgi:hypothetical protein